MFDSVFTFDSITGNVTNMTDGQLFATLGASLLLGLVIAISYWFGGRASKHLAVSLFVLPVIVQTVIMMVNGNVGAGVAVMGAFSLVRFRSVPGTAKEICALFLAMGAGLIAGMGYLGFAALFAAVMCVAFMAYNRLDLGSKRNAATFKTLTITIPEDLDWSGIFDDIFAEYTTTHDLVRVKSSNMGSLFKLTYTVMLRDVGREKEMIDAIRCRNGNLEIAVSKQETVGTEL